MPNKPARMLLLFLCCNQHQSVSQSVSGVAQVLHTCPENKLPINLPTKHVCTSQHNTCLRQHPCLYTPCPHNLQLFLPARLAVSMFVCTQFPCCWLQQQLTHSALP